MAYADDHAHRSRPRRPGAALAASLTALAVAALTLAAGPAGGQGEQSQIDEQRAKVRALEASLLQVDGEMGDAQSAYEDADTTVRRLETRIADNSRQQRIAQRNFVLSQRRLATRLRNIYANDPPSMIEVLVSSGSLTSAVDSYDMVRRVASQDTEMVEGFAAARTRLVELRSQLVADRREAARNREETARRLSQLRSLAGERRRLLGAAVTALDGMEAAAAQQAALRAAQRRAAIAARPDSTPEQVTSGGGSLLPQTPAGTAAAPQAESGGVDAHLARIAQCESGGNPRAISPGGTYRGKYQFLPSTWASVGGTGDPAAASEAEQDLRARILYERAGPGQWPVCSLR